MKVPQGKRSGKSHASLRGKPKRLVGGDFVTSSHKSNFSGCGSPRKGQLMFEFIVVMVFFMSIVLFFVNYLDSTVSMYSAESFSGEMKGKASQVAEVLVLSKGNWSGEEPLSVGLAEDWPVLNDSKIAWLDNYCSYPENYSNLLKSFWDDPKNITLKIAINETLADGTINEIVDCPAGLDVPKIKRAEAKRYALYFDSDTGLYETLTLYVYIW